MDFKDNKIPGEVVSKHFFEKAASHDPTERQKLAEALEDYTLLTVREEGLFRRVMPPAPITMAEMDKQIDTDKPVKIVDKEVNQPLSVSVPFATLPRNFWMRGDRYRVEFGRQVTRNFVADRIQLENYDYDIRNRFKETAIKDLCYSEDIPWITTWDSIVTPSSPATTGTWAAAGKAAAVSPVTGKVQYYNFTNATQNPLGNTDGLTRDNFVESFKILGTGYTPSGFKTGTSRGPKDDQSPIRHHAVICVMNNNTGLEFAKWDHDERGGPLAQETLRDGITETTWMGKKFIFTSKDDIIRDGEMWMFAAPEFVGKFYELESPTIFLDTRAYMTEFFGYSAIGASIGNPFSGAKVTFFS